MCRKRPFATHARARLPTPTAVCRIPCLILCLADVRRMCQCRAPNAPYEVNGRMASVTASLKPTPQWKGRPQSPDAVATLLQLAATASLFLRFRVSGAAPVRRLQRNEISEKPCTIHRRPDYRFSRHKVTVARRRPVAGTRSGTDRLRVRRYPARPSNGFLPVPEGRLRPAF